MADLSRAALERRLEAIDDDDLPAEDRALELTDIAWELALMDPDRTLALGEKAAALSDEARVRGRVLRNRGYVDMTQGRMQGALTSLREARDIFIVLSAPEDQRTVEDSLAHCYLNVGAAETALEHATRGLELARASGDGRAVGWALHTIGGVHHALRDYDEAERWYRDAIPIFEDAKYPVGVARLLSRLAASQMRAGRLADARDNLARALPLWRRSEVRMGEAHALLDLAKVEVDLGAPQAALAHIDAAEALEVEQSVFTVLSKLRRGEALSAAGRDDEALALIDAAVELASQSDLREAMTDAYTARAKHLEKAGRTADAFEALKAERALAQRLQDEDARSRARNVRIAMKVAAQQREAEVTERLLLDVLPAPIVRELRLRGRADPVFHPDATVLFTDFVGFTQISAQMDPSTLVEQLDRMFRRFDEVSKRWGLEKLKTIGDAYMAVAGVPAPQPGHAVSAALAALHLREAVRTAAVPQGQTPWSVRIGLHSGPLVAGVIGRAKLAYDVWGDTVNTASRMESSGERDRINVSATTHALLEPYFVCEHRGSVQAKGKGRIDMMFVHRLRPEFCRDEAGLHPNDRLPRGG